MTTAADSFIPYKALSFPEDEMRKRSEEFFHFLDGRRTVRDFSTKDVPREIVENIIKAASTAPSGAHKQPWTFCVIGDPLMKREIRVAAENEEYINYNGRMSEEWLEDLKPLATDEFKPFLEDAPWLIVVMKKSYDETNEGGKKKNYYVNESVGLAAGMLIAAIHNAGLVTVTHTPSPMNFLHKILNRPANEKPFLLLPIGYPKENVKVPDLQRKTLDEMAAFYI